jgi:hypothetical protein
MERGGRGSVSRLHWTVTADVSQVSTASSIRQAVRRQLVPLNIYVGNI